jgi:lysine 2,3-aminomutase
MDRSQFGPEGLKAANPMIFSVARRERGLESMRRRLAQIAQDMEFETFRDYARFREGSIIRVRDCAQAFRSMLTRRSEDITGFSVAKAIRDFALDKPRPDLAPAFHADMLHLLLGLQGRGPGKAPADEQIGSADLSGREAAIERSRQLDDLWNRIQEKLENYPCGLDEDAVRRREERKRLVLDVIGAAPENWESWHWQMRNAVRDAGVLQKIIPLDDGEIKAIEEAGKREVPFGITPYYL